MKTTTHRCAILGCGKRLALAKTRTYRLADIEPIPCCPACWTSMGFPETLWDSEDFPLHRDNEALRAIFPRILQALGNGADCTPTVSLEFLQAIPGEVQGVIRHHQNLSGDLISVIRLNNLRRTWAAATIQQVDEFLQPFLARRFAVAHSPQCTWTRNQDGQHHTTCGRIWEFQDGGTVEDHAARYCHHCGLPIHEVPYTEPEHENPHQ